MALLGHFLELRPQSLFLSLARILFISRRWVLRVSVGVSQNARDAVSRIGSFPTNTVQFISAYVNSSGIIAGCGLRCTGCYSGFGVYVFGI